MNCGTVYLFLTTVRSSSGIVIGMIDLLAAVVGMIPHHESFEFN